jgi:vancomycin resistance protein YoaR
MPSSRRILIIAGLVLGSLFVLFAAAFGFDRFVHSGEVLRNVEVSGVDLSGLDEIGADAELTFYEEVLVNSAAPFTVDGSNVDLDPVTVGFELNTTEAVAAAMATGRDGSVFSQFGWWFGHLFSKESLMIDGTVDPEALDTVLTDWDRDLITKHPSPGDVLLIDGTPVAQYPESGLAIDRQESKDLILSSLLTSERERVTLPTTTVSAPLTDTHIDAAVASATRMLSGAVTLSRVEPEVSVVFTAADLREAFETEVVLEPEPLLLVGFSADAVGAKLAPLRNELEVPPVDARFEFGEEDDSITLLPGRPGTQIDPELAAMALEQAALTVSRTGEMPFEDGADPDVTTADLEELGIVGLMSKASTNHPCCQPRVENIHLFADIVDDTIVMPGESLSLNELVGQRTTDRGFKPAPTIIGGKIIDTVGGGVSQFATTFYNAVFWGGYEDVTHTPHSYYFSRYPEGIEATISWPLPNLEFRNDTDAAVLIKTEYDDTTITVKFYGDNGGRLVEGEVSGRYNFTEPTTDWVANDELAPDEQEVNVEGRSGWSVTVRRFITEPDGVVREESWVVKYKAQEGYTGEDCPIPETTTTTTLPPPSTTTSTTAPPG